jgi:hypothetical protein
MFDTTHVICALLDVSDCRAELYVNGFPVARRGPSGVINAAVPVQQFLVPGTNELELLVEPGRTPSQARSEERRLKREGAHASARLMRFRDGAMATKDNGEILCEVLWRSAQGGAHDPDEPALLADPARFPKSRVGRCDLGPLAGRWSWQDAPPLDPGPALFAEARGVLDAVVRAFEAGSVDDFRKLVKVPGEEIRRAYPVWTEAMVREGHARFISFYGKEGKPFLPRSPARHDFRLVAGGRVLECIDDDYQTSLKLRAPESGEAVPYALFLARIDGSLAIVRG